MDQDYREAGDYGTHNDTDINLLVYLWTCKNCCRNGVKFNILNTCVKGEIRMRTYRLKHCKNDETHNTHGYVTIAGASTTYLWTTLPLKRAMISWIPKLLFVANQTLK